MSFSPITLNSEVLSFFPPQGVRGGREKKEAGGLQEVCHRAGGMTHLLLIDVNLFQWTDSFCLSWRQRWAAARIRTCCPYWCLLYQKMAAAASQGGLSVIHRRCSSGQSQFSAYSRKGGCEPAVASVAVQSTCCAVGCSIVFLPRFAHSRSWRLHCKQLQAIASTCEKKTQMQDLQAHLRSGMGDTKSVDPSALPDANSAASLQITFESIERHVCSLQRCWERPADLCSSC